MLKSNPLARYFLTLRNEHLHGGPNPTVSGAFSQGKATYYFTRQHSKYSISTPDALSACRSYFIILLNIIYDCYAKPGIHIDPQQYYTKEHFTLLNKTIDDAEIEILGWVCSSLIEEGFIEDDRWHELRGQVGECLINHLFQAYLGKTTPQPIEPEHYKDFDFTNEERGWVHIPAGYSTIGEWLRELHIENNHNTKPRL